MINAQATIDVVLTNGERKITAITVPWRARIHRICVTRLGEVTSAVTCRIFESSAALTLGDAPNDPADGDLVGYQVGPKLASADFASIGGHIATFYERGMAYMNRESNQASKAGKLYVELVAGGAGAGTYRVTIQTATDESH